jgi:4-amino-4-deoxy-L-arabinose transferase-like glycosyltransferase
MSQLLPYYRLVIVALITWVLSWLCLNPLAENRFGPQSDEGYYYHYAQQVAQKGPQAFSELISWYSSNEEALNHPAPIRAGYILLIGTLFKVFGPSYHILGLCSTLSFMIFLGLCFYYIRKYFNLDTALLSVLLLSSSPLLLGLSRRALLDSPINLLWGAAAWVFLDYLLDPKRLKYALLVMLLAVSLTVKEMSVILIPFFILSGLCLKPHGRSLSIKELAGIALWPMVLVGLFYLWVLGGISSLMTAMDTILKVHLAPSTNPYAIYYSSGPWFRYILDFLLLNPIVTILFVGYAGYLLVQRSQLDLKRTYFLSFFIFIYSILSLLPHSKVVRFVVNLEMVMGLFAVLMLGEVFKSERQRKWLMVVALLIFVYNWVSFIEIFYEKSLLDPISYHLLVLRHFIPAQ